jgi:GNAT superfamily N-acetyltransferase
MNTNYIIRKGEPKDVEGTFALIQELALYEKAPHEVTNSPEQMLIDGFGENPIFNFHVAESEGKIVGISVYYVRYSTWKGRCLYLEDIIVTEAQRGQGVGKLLFDATVQEAVNQNASLLVWQVLDWNEPAIRFYERLDASFDATWVNCKLTKDQMQNWKYGLN